MVRTETTTLEPDMEATDLTEPLHQPLTTQPVARDIKYLFKLLPLLDKLVCTNLKSDTTK